MNIEQIIFNTIKTNAHTWVRYWISNKTEGLTFPGEYIEIRSSLLTRETLKGLLDVGFKIEKIRSQKINADSYCDVLLRRGLSGQQETLQP